MTKINTIVTKASSESRLHVWHAKLEEREREREREVIYYQRQHYTTVHYF